MSKKLNVPLLMTLPALACALQTFVPLPVRPAEIPLLQSVTILLFFGSGPASIVALIWLRPLTFSSSRWLESTSFASLLFLRPLGFAGWVLLAVNLVWLLAYTCGLVLLLNFPHPA